MLKTKNPRWTESKQLSFLQNHKTNLRFKNSKYLRRAVVLFVPPLRKYINEFINCLYNSWLFTCKQRRSPKDSCPVKTDLIAFMPACNFKLLPEEFVEIKLSPNGDYKYSDGAESPLSRCYYVQMDTVNQNVWKYVFTDSMVYLAEQKNFPLLLSYDLVLKTEGDTFLTKKFSNWLPNYFTVGNGKYATLKVVKENILRVAEKCSKALYQRTRHKWVHDIGATMYGHPLLLIQSFSMAVEILKELLFSEFASDRGKWPGWYRGVSSMYAIEIGVNFALSGSEFRRENLLLDHFSTCGKVSETAHIHCWHTWDFFSKFDFNSGKYEYLRKIKIAETDYVPYYCLKIALGKFDREDFIEDSEEIQKSGKKICSD